MTWFTSYRNGFESYGTDSKINAIFQDDKSRILAIPLKLVWADGGGSQN